MKTSKLIVQIAVLSLSLTSLASAGNLSSTVDRNQISPNETLTLTVTYDEQIDSSLLQLDSLKKDFDILSVSPQTSSSVTIVNGQASRQATTVWSITLIAKRSGSLEIPVFSVLQDVSEPIIIEVSENTSTASSSVPLTARVSTDRASLFPSQQLVVEVELSAQATVSDLNGPQLIINGADVELLDQRRFQRIENGIARQIVSLRYAAYPQAQGELVIPVMTYTGIKGGRRSLFGTRGQQVIARTLQLEVPVIAEPTGNGQQWFPANSVEISSNWSSDIGSIKVGEPITRTIMVTTMGQRASLIPRLARPDTNLLYKTYQDQPQLQNQKTVEGIVGIRTESEAIVASSEGELLLPELKLDWWNVKEEQWQTAILPAESLQISAAAMTNAPTNINQTKELSGVPAGGESSSQVIEQPIWKWMTLMLGLLSLIQFVLIYRLRKNKAVKQITKSNETPPSEMASWGTLQNSFKTGNAKTIRKDLIKWAESSIPSDNHVSLKTIAENAARYSNNSDASLQLALTELDEHLYKNNKEFNSQHITREVTQLRKQILAHKKASGTESKSDLQPLYRS